ncbi:glutathione S-transferase C-terminal-like protein [Epithele typhae]|uniref:glutathione S-transferase C-terminal-like protein n=1 Tax=Epithele typhae TaxID=378194 RepID=UPI002007EEAF|nr:glutathione S-transferase C-terminal-like protein [Epithele typhae]KAH9910405.1 glutathione S-transferase C-terminal-like protein [Epithele typhae]
MSHGKQFTLYSHKMGPNGWKVAMVLEELGLTYESIYLDFFKGEQKAPAYTQYNPNGRTPTLIDHHNGDLTIWESGAIILYLADKYDQEGKLSPAQDDELGRHELSQWLFFQASGQGPYFGQLRWFQRRHPEKLPSAITRYQNEVIRVFGVLESVLSKQAWLLGDKCTVADISFVIWNQPVVALGLLSDVEGMDVPTKFPAFYAWHQKLVAREAVKKILERSSENALAQVESKH